MANTDAPNGFTPIRHLTGGTIRMSEYPMLTSYSTKIHSGDPVIMDTTGYIAISGATPTNLVGVFAGCSYKNAAGDVIYAKYWDGATTHTDAVAYVYDDPKIVFSVQHDGTAALADNNATFDITNTAGTDLTGRSNMELSTSSKATDAPIRQLRIVDRADNAWGANADVECIFEDHVWNGTAGAADAS
jgi:hypothetical protein